jgi:hypothetical protein
VPLLLVQVNAASRVPLFELAEWSDFATFAPKGAKWVAIEFGGTPLEDFEHPPNAVYLLGAEDVGLPTAVLRALHVGKYGHGRILYSLGASIGLGCCREAVRLSSCEYRGSDPFTVEHAGARAMRRSRCRRRTTPLIMSPSPVPSSCTTVRPSPRAGGRPQRRRRLCRRAAGRSGRRARVPRGAKRRGRAGARAQTGWSNKIYRWTLRRGGYQHRCLLSSQVDRSQHPPAV